MKRFIAGENRQQTTLLPDCLDDYITADNPVRLVEVFVDELDLTTLGFAGHGPSRLPSGDVAQDLSLRLPQPRSVEPAARTREPAQHRVDLADWSADARLQDAGRLP